MTKKKTEPKLEVKAGDLRPELTDVLEDRDGNAVDLSTASEVRFYLEHRASGDLIVNQPAEITDATAGAVAYEFQSGDTGRTGRHRGEWVVTYSDGDVQSFPPDRFLAVDIAETTARSTDPASLDPEDVTVGTITADTVNADTVLAGVELTLPRYDDPANAPQTPGSVIEVTGAGSASADVYRYTGDGYTQVGGGSGGGLTITDDGTEVASSVQSVDAGENLSGSENSDGSVTLDAAGGSGGDFLDTDDDGVTELQTDHADFGGGDARNIGALSTGEILGIADRIFTGGESVTEINNALATTGNTVVLAGDHSSLSDRIEIGADNVELVIRSSATVRLADDASPTALTDSQGEDHTPLIYATGRDRLTIKLEGVLDANNTNHSKTRAIFLDNTTNSEILQTEPAKIIDPDGGVFLIDCSQITTRGITVRNTGADTAGIGLEGCTDCDIIDTKCINGAEALDLNAYNENIRVRNVVGVDLSADVVDINCSPNCTFEGVHSVGTCLKIIDIDNAAGPRFTDATAISHSNNLTFSNVTGTSSGVSIFLDCRGGAVANCTLSDINVHSTGVEAVRAYPQNDGEINDLRIEGKASTDATDVPVIYPGGDPATSGLVLDVETEGGRAGVQLIGVSDVTGTVKATGASGDAGVILVSRSGTSGATFGDMDLRVLAYDNDGNGIKTAGGGTIQNVTLRGRVYGNTGDDILLDDSCTDTRLDIAYGTLTDNGTNTVEAQYS